MLAQLHQAATPAATVPVAAPAVPAPVVPAPVAIPAPPMMPAPQGPTASGLLGDLRTAYDNLVKRLAEFAKRLLSPAPKPEPAPPEAKPEPAPAPPAPPEPAKPAPAPTYTVQKGDSLSAIAKRTLGDGNRWREIYDLNRDVIGSNPNVIHAGQTLKLPGGAQAPKPAPPAPPASPPPAAGPSYTVRSGDSLSAIAGRTLGNSNRWREIYDLNRDVIGGNPNQISAGMTLRLPGGANASAPPAAPSKPSGKWQWPTAGRKTSNYGNRKHPITGVHKLHSGMDIGAGTGTAVHVVQGGKVSFAGWNGGYGNYVVVDHGNGLQTAYAHLSKINVSKGQSVGARDVIGKVGSTGMSTGPHLHFEVKKNGSFVDPAAYIA
jgi:murein DD-endopeptidase MepM/ murein hydrolase activator NlpD